VVIFTNRKSANSRAHSAIVNPQKYFFNVLTVLNPRLSVKKVEVICLTRLTCLTQTAALASLKIIQIEEPSPNSRLNIAEIFRTHCLNFTTPDQSKMFCLSIYFSIQLARALHFSRLGLAMNLKILGQKSKPFCHCLLFIRNSF
jgi:hypothetical protein